MLIIMLPSYWPSYRSLCYHPTDRPTDHYANILLTILLMIMLPSYCMCSYWPSYRSLCFHPTDNHADHYVRWLGRVIHCTLLFYILPLPYFHSTRTSIAHFHSTRTSIAVFPFYTHFHCRTSILPWYCIAHAQYNIYQEREPCGRRYTSQCWDCLLLWASILLYPLYSNSNSCQEMNLWGCTLELAFRMNWFVASLLHWMVSSSLWVCWSAYWENWIWDGELGNTI